MRRLFFLFCTTAVFAVQAHAAPERTKVKLSCTCTDPVGEQYATAVHDLLANNPRFVETAQEKEGPDENVVLTVVSLDTDKQHPGVSSAISAVYTLGAVYIFDQRLQICDPGRVRECASNALAALDQDMRRGIE